MSLPRENGFGHYRSAVIPRLLRTTGVNSWMKRARVKLKPAFNDLGIRPMAWLVQRALQPDPKPSLSPNFLNELHTAFAADVALMEQLTGRTLPHWLAGPVMKEKVSEANDGSDSL
jgi:hypothetical protein